MVDWKFDDFIQTEKTTTLNLFFHSANFWKHFFLSLLKYSLYFLTILVTLFFYVLSKNFIPTDRWQIKCRKHTFNAFIECTHLHMTNFSNSIIGWKRRCIHEILHFPTLIEILCHLKRRLKRFFLFLIISLPFQFLT